jgi:nitrite reductase/ring-hydroxylating ferredoxin subunit
MSETPATAADTMPAGADAPWHPLDVDPAGAEFPVRARCGAEQILVFKTKDGFRGTARVCPHQFFPLSDAILQGDDKMLRCRRHSYVFRLNDGKGINCPGYKLKVYEIKQENGALFVRAV